jgi:hypothetical protein
MAAGPSFIDGFDHYNSVAMLEKKWTIVTDNGITFGSTLKGAAGGSLNLPSGASVEKTTDTPGSNTNTNPLGFYCKRDAAVARTLFSAYSGSTLQVKVVWRADGAFDIYDATGSVNVTTNKKANALNTVYHFELAMNNSTTTSAGNFYIDGIAANTATITFSNVIVMSRFVLGGTISAADSAACGFSFDHLFTKVISGGQIGPAEILTVFPDGDGATNNWTSSAGGSKYADVDENPPDEADYNFASTSGISQFWKFPITYPTGYSPNGYALTVLGAIATSQTMSARQSNTDGGAENSADNISGTFVLGSQFLEFLFNNSPTIVSGHAFLGMRRVS